MRGRGVPLLSEEGRGGGVYIPRRARAGFESRASEPLLHTPRPPRPDGPRVQQVADEKTRMQFSIRRPKLPSSETHPEESMYRRLDVAAWLRHLNALGQVEEEYKLRKVRPGDFEARGRGRAHGPLPRAGFRGRGGWAAVGPLTPAAV